MQRTKLVRDLLKLNRVKKALKRRIYICEGEWIYYKKSDGRNKNGIWRGPEKVVAVNGKNFFIDHGASLSTVN